jgi:VCBS repeat-containing protein
VATQADLAVALATTLHDSTGTGTGSVDWDFAIPDQDLDFLSAGETLTATYDVTVFEGTTSSTPTVTITMTSAQDTAIVINPITASIADTSATDDGQVVAVGNLITDAGDSAGHLANSLSVTDVNGQPVAGSLDVAGAYGTLIDYIANASSTLFCGTKSDRAIELHGQRQFRSQHDNHAYSTSPEAARRRPSRVLRHLAR